ncbi:MAG TPA: hypothetical protein VFD43_00265 [Planctomycetota bacterium]|nr:hypothetical protein [Planctomycetota bacterium]
MTSSLADDDLAAALTPRWTRLRYHPEQARLRRSRASNKVVAAGRRSGKTEIEKREGVREALSGGADHLFDWRGFFAAPTRDQAKAIYWDDAKDLMPERFVRRYRESELTIELVHGPRLRVVGMDKPMRLEGGPIDWICLDEYGDMRPDTLTRTVLPALATPGRRRGQLRMIGKPKLGARHFRETFNRARTGDLGPDWEGFWWPSGDIMPAHEIELLRQSMDPLSFAQEIEASWVNAEGRAYQQFVREEHAREPLRGLYDPLRPLVMAFDFNVDPGVAVVGQEVAFHAERPAYRPEVDRYPTAWLGEVWIPQNGYVPNVCRRLLEDWGAHRGEVHLYGDATGGSRHATQVEGTAWQMIREYLRPTFGDRLRVMVPRKNPPERARIDAVNTRLRTADGKVHAIFDPQGCPHLIEDLESVTLVKGGTGELDKSDLALTHPSDAAGYYHAEKHSLSPLTLVEESFY